MNGKKKSVSPDGPNEVKSQWAIKIERGKYVLSRFADFLTQGFRKIFTVWLMRKIGKDFFIRTSHLSYLSLPSHSSFSSFRQNQTLRLFSQNQKNTTPAFEFRSWTFSPTFIVPLPPPPGPSQPRIRNPAITNRISAGIWSRTREGED